jgi:hypothetical protein
MTDQSENSVLTAETLQGMIRKNRDTAGSRTGISLAGSIVAVVAEAGLFGTLSLVVALLSLQSVITKRAKEQYLGLLKNRIEDGNLSDADKKIMTDDDNKKFSARVKRYRKYAQGALIVMAGAILLEYLLGAPNSIVSTVASFIQIPAAMGALVLYQITDNGEARKEAIGEAFGPGLSEEAARCRSNMTLDQAVKYAAARLALPEKGAANKFNNSAVNDGLQKPADTAAAKPKSEDLKP